MNTIAISKALQQLEQCYGNQLVGIAATMHLTRSLLRQQQAAHGINLSAQLAVLDAMLASHLAAQKVPRAEFEAALDALVHVGQKRTPEPAH